VLDSFDSMLNETASDRVVHISAETIRVSSRPAASCATSSTNIFLLEVSSSVFRLRISHRCQAQSHGADFTQGVLIALAVSAYS
jgi:hypothetical protein